MDRKRRLGNSPRHPAGGLHVPRRATVGRARGAALVARGEAVVDGSPGAGSPARAAIAAQPRWNGARASSSSIRERSLVLARPSGERGLQAKRCTSCSVRARSLSARRWRCLPHRRRQNRRTLDRRPLSMLVSTSAHTATARTATSGCFDRGKRAARPSRASPGAPPARRACRVRPAPMDHRDRRELRASPVRRELPAPPDRLARLATRALQRG